MVKESLKRELEKLDELQRKYEQVMGNYIVHIRSDRVDLFAQDEIAYKEAMEAWRIQFDRIYRMSDRTEECQEENKETAAYESCAESQDVLTSLVNVGPVLSAKRREKGLFIVTVFKDDVQQEIFSAEEYEIPVGVPESKCTVIKVKRQGCQFFERYSKWLGYEVLISDAETGNYIYSMQTGEEVVDFRDQIS